MNEAAESLRNEIRVEAAGSSAFEVEAFAAVFAARLEDAEQVFDLNPVFLSCRGPRNKRLELLGYAEDGTDGTLTILCGKYFAADETLTMTEARDVMDRASGFVENAVSGWLLENLEISSREYEYAEYFQKRRSSGELSRVRVVLVTDGVMSSRIKTLDTASVAGLRATYEIWDQNRILDAALPELGSEDIKIDFRKWMPEGLPCLVAETSTSTSQTYLAAIPGRILVEVFAEYGSLLLESNVRTFLSTRVAVNRGIQATLAQEPERFLAYNNGLTTTATRVRLSNGGCGSSILELDKWQIVNGGQTTASIAHFLRNGKDRNVDDVWVQMKLVTVSDEDSGEMVHAVAKYANSQNKVSGADLFATHEFHVRMEQISRRLRVPAKEGEQFETAWFYERARGQWENDRIAHASQAARKKFDLEFPKSQKITKTDWAKYIYSWQQRPDLVSKGAQSVFVEYANAVDSAWESNPSQFGDGYFRKTIAKAIIFETLRKRIMQQAWYKESTGYLANITTYAIARFAYQLNTQLPDQRLDFEAIWRRQTLSEPVLEELTDFARKAQAHLTDARRPQANVTQWAKQPACWERFKSSHASISRDLSADLVSAGESKDQAREDRKQRSMDSGFETIERVLKVEIQTWTSVAESSMRVGISPVENELIRKFVGERGNVPTERQAQKLIAMLDRFRDAGEIPADSY